MDVCDELVIYDNQLDSGKTCLDNKISRETHAIPNSSTRSGCFPDRITINNTGTGDKILYPGSLPNSLSKQALCNEILGVGDCDVYGQPAADLPADLETRLSNNLLCGSELMPHDSTTCQDNVYYFNLANTITVNSTSGEIIYPESIPASLDKQTLCNNILGITNGCDTDGQPAATSTIPTDLQNKVLCGSELIDKPAVISTGTCVGDLYNFNFS